MIYSFANEQTGRFSTRRVSCNERLLALNTPPGHVAVKGAHDHRTRRLDVNALIESGGAPHDHVVDYERPAEEVEAESVARRDEDARLRLREIDLKMVRPLAQLLKNPQDAVARAALDELAIQADEVRADVVPTGGEIERATRLRQT